MFMDGLITQPLPIFAPNIFNKNIFKLEIGNKFDLKIIEFTTYQKTLIKNDFLCM